MYTASNTERGFIMDLEMVSYLSKLGKLSFTEEEMKKKASEMTSIIEIMDTIKEIDIKYDALADNHDVYLNDLREDFSLPSMPTEKIIQNATSSNNYFVVPKVVE
jgi:aspartyl-tRNA(Asn)/glutamyl-tRNA(Gln) amidotransferase subunit C